jgi:DNA-binding XRE family transcriptional regulator
MAARVHSTQRKRRVKNRDFIALRVNAGLSREQLATKAGCSRELIRRIESESYVPASARVQFQIAAVFDRLPLDLWPIEKQRAVAA